MKWREKYMFSACLMDYTIDAGRKEKCLGDINIT
jgi:hypothetical protein